MSCPQLKLCLNNDNLAAARLIRGLERTTLIGLKSLWTKGRPIVSPKLNLPRALFVLGKIDEILV